MLKLTTKLLGFFLLLVVSGCGHNRFSIFHKTEPLSINNYWAVLSQEEQIYTSAFPLFSNTVTQDRGIHYLMVAYNTKTKEYAISVVGGKNYAPLSEVIIKVNYNEYYLPVAVDRARLTNQKQVNNFIKDTLASDVLMVINTFNDDSQAIDTYSLKGFKESFKLLDTKQK